MADFCYVYVASCTYATRTVLYVYSFTFYGNKSRISIPSLFHQIERVFNKYVSAYIYKRKGEEGEGDRLKNRS